MWVCTKSSLLFSLLAPDAASLHLPVLHNVCLALHPRQGFPTSLLLAWAASEHSDGVTWDFLSHHGISWARPVSCKEGFTLKSLLACVLLSKRVAGPCSVAVLLCWISSFLALCVREWWLTVDIKSRFSCVQRSLFRWEWALMGKRDQFSVFYPLFLFFLLKGGIPIYLRRICTLIRLRSYLDPMLKLDVPLKCVSKGNTSYWFNTCLMVRRNGAEPVATAKHLQSHQACSPDLCSSGLSSGLPILPWWFLKGAERNQRLNAFIEFCTLCGWK